MTTIVTYPVETQESADIAKVMGQTLSRLRDEAGLSTAELAERACMTQEQVTGLETGEFEPGLDAMVALAGSLGTDAATLSEGVEWIPAEKKGRWKLTARA